MCEASLGRSDTTLIEKGKISSLQMAMMMHTTILATVILSAPSVISLQAKRDMWISPIWASATAFIIILITWQMHKLHPQKSLIEFGESVLGKIIGKCLGLLFILFYLHICGIILREYGEFVVSSFLKKTPLIVIIGAMMLVCGYAVRSGVEVIGRSTQIIVPIVILLFVCIPLLLMPDLEPSQLLPIFENGIGPSLMGSIVPMGWFSEYLLVSFLFPYINDQGRTVRWSIISILSVIFIMLIANVMLLMLYGNTVSSHTYPVMSAARYISLADFIAHVESFVMALWVAGVFIKISVFYYAISIGTAQWLNLSDYKPIVLPIGFILIVLSLWCAPNFQSLSEFLTVYFPFYSIAVQIVIPCLLLIFALFQHAGKKKKLDNR